MRQLSLIFDDYAALAGLMPAVRAAMRRAEGEPESEGRKLLVDKINHIARQAEVIAATASWYGKLMIRNFMAIP